jgi:hypothetical protein
MYIGVRQVCGCSPSIYQGMDIDMWGPNQLVTIEKKKGKKTYVGNLLFTHIIAISMFRWASHWPRLVKYTQVKRVSIVASINKSISFIKVEFGGIIWVYIAKKMNIRKKSCWKGTRKKEGWLGLMIFFCCVIYDMHESMHFVTFVFFI